MTRMLASVTGLAEAEVALAGGADIIDLKDPARGGFAAVAMATLRETVAHVRGRRQVSAVLGDLAMQPAAVCDAAAAMAEMDLIISSSAFSPMGTAGLHPRPRAARRAMQARRRAVRRPRPGSSALPGARRRRICRSHARHRRQELATGCSTVWTCPPCTASCAPVASNPACRPRRRAGGARRAAPSGARAWRCSASAVRSAALRGGPARSTVERCRRSAH